MTTLLARMPRQSFLCLAIAAMTAGALASLVQDAISHSAHVAHGPTPPAVPAPAPNRGAAP